MQKLRSDLLEKVHDCQLVSEWERETGQKSPKDYTQTERKFFQTWKDVGDLISESLPFMTATSSWALERWIALCCFLGSTVALSALIYSTLHVPHRMSVLTFTALFLLGLIPFLIMVAVNYIILWVTLGGFRGKYHKLWTDYILNFENYEHMHVVTARMDLEKRRIDSKQRDVGTS